jgi:hypothetical protein
LVNPWSRFGQNPTQNPLNPFWPTSVSRYFCRVLQISPKHFKISQCKSCVFCRGTQLSCWVAFEIWSLNWWKMQVNASRYYSLEPRFLQSSTAFLVFQLHLVKFITNYRKIQKFQIQFCCALCNKNYNFLQICIYFWAIVFAWKIEK